MNTLANKIYVVLHLVPREDGTVETILATIINRDVLFNKRKLSTFRLWVWPLSADEYERSLFASTGKGLPFPSAIKRFFDWLCLQNIDVNDPNQVMLAVPHNFDLVQTLKLTIRRLQKITKKSTDMHYFFQRWINIGDHVTVPNRLKTESPEDAVAILLNSADAFAQHIRSQIRVEDTVFKKQETVIQTNVVSPVKNLKKLHPGVERVIANEIRNQFFKKKDRVRASAKTTSTSQIAFKDQTCSDEKKPVVEHVICDDQDLQRKGRARASTETMGTSQLAEQPILQPKRRRSQQSGKKGDQKRGDRKRKAMESVTCGCWF